MDIRTFNKLNVSEMRKVVGRLVSAGNKRVRNFQKAGESSPAIRQLEKSGGLLSTKGKDLNALRSEYSRAKNFLESKSSTRAGWKTIKKETIENMRKQGVDITPDKLDKVLKVYERLKQIDPSITAKALKYKTMNEISSMPEQMDVEEMILAMEDRIDELYEENSGVENEFTGVSGFFEM